MLRSCYIFWILGVLYPCLYAKQTMFYRIDYTYIEQFDAFYKMYWDPNVDSWNSAFKACDDEGAQLFYPKMKDEWMVAKILKENLVEQPNTTDIFIGLHDQFNISQFITIDGHSTESPLGLDKSISTHPNCVVMDIESGNFSFYTCVTEKPFICKKVEDVSCPTVDREYKYVKPLNKCYKVIHKEEMHWNDAMKTCYMEGGILAPLETESDFNAIVPLVEKDTFYFIGFRKMFNIDTFYTVKGKIYENSFFRDWYESRDEKDRDCGAFQYNGDLRRTEIIAAYCQNDEAQFICEMDLKQQPTNQHY